MKARRKNLWRLPLLAAAMVAMAALGGSSAVAKLAASRSEIKFVAMQADVPVAGAFKHFSADVDFDPARPAFGKLNIVIDVASVDTGSTDADDMLKTKGFFDAAHFPQATFVSTAIAAEGADKFRASGSFTLKGRSVALAVPFSARPEGNELRFEGSAPVSRLAYKVGEGEWADTGTLADSVQIKFTLYVPR